MALRKNMKFEDWLEVLLRWKWLILFSFIIFLFSGLVYSVVSTEYFKSTSTVLVIPQKIDEEYIKSTTRENREIGLIERINTLQIQILSRTRLLNIINDLNLFPKLRSEEGEATAVKEMRKRIVVEPLKADKRFEKLENVFSISYEHEDPQSAMLVNSMLTSMFIEENVKSREQQVLGAIQLFETEIEETEKRIEEKDKAIKEFRSRYLGELPEQLNTNMEMLRRYQDDLKSNADAIRDAEDQRILLASQVAELKAQLGIIGTQSKNNEGQDSSDTIRELSIYSQLTEKKGLLAQLRLKYTENHPEIRKILAEIRELEKKAKGVEVDKNRLDREYSVFASPEAAKLTQQLTILVQGKKAKELEIKNLKQKHREIEAQIEQYRIRVGNTPAREEKLKELVRDYENLKAYYEDLLAKKMSANLSKTMESRQQGEHFEVIDPPSLPDKPYKPNRMLILMASFVFSLAIGVGGSIGFEYWDKSLKSPGEFKDAIDVPVLISLPLVPTKTLRRGRLIKKAMIIGGLVLYFSAVLIFLVLYMDKIKLIITGGK